VVEIVVAPVSGALTEICGRHGRLYKIDSTKIGSISLNRRQRSKPR
jgi:hypothetical protein